MPIEVTDTPSHRQEKIANAARVLGRSKQKQQVFAAICFGKKSIKPIERVEEKSGLSYKQVLNTAVSLQHEGLIKPAPKINGRKAYEKDSFYAKNCKKILALARNTQKLDKFPTAYTPKLGAGLRVSVTVKPLAKKVRAERITIDDVDSFSKVRAIVRSGPSGPLSEKKFKQGLKDVLDEKGAFTDWGGETDDLFSPRVWVRGKRLAGAFGLKGKATKGKLTPKKMGKNGDQIQRLFRSPADVFIVQYWGEVDSTIYELMKSLASYKSFAEGRPIYYAVIDGQDSRRLIQAYPKYFRKI
jgi:hypothetical protein